MLSSVSFPFLGRLSLATLFAWLLLPGIGAGQPVPGRSIAQHGETVRSVVPAPATSIGAKSRVALVVGNGTYRSLPRLRNPAHDAIDLCTVLRDLQFDVHCLTDVADRAEFRRVLRDFASRLGPGTMAVFYYAGHAVQLRGDNYLLPTMVSPSSQIELEDDSVALSHVLRLLEDARSAPNLIILDACRDDPFRRDGPVQVNPGLARVDPPVGSLLVFATAPGRTALDGDGRNGLFTKHLLTHLRHPNVPLSELLQQVASDVEREAREKYRTQQVPYRSFSYSGTLCLADCDDARASAQLAELKRRSEQAAERIRALSIENARLSEAARARQPQDRAPARESELSELRQALLEYQQRIDVLERESADRTRGRAASRPQSAESRPRPLVVPNF